MNVELTVLMAGRNLTGVLAFYDPYVRIPLDFGFFDNSSHAFYMTSGELGWSTRWAQLRGQFTPDAAAFHGYYILSGEGIKYKLDLIRKGSLN